MVFLKLFLEKIGFLHGVFAGVTTLYVMAPRSIPGGSFGFSDHIISRRSHNVPREHQLDTHRNNMTASVVRGQRMSRYQSLLLDQLQQRGSPPRSPLTTLSIRFHFHQRLPSAPNVYQDADCVLAPPRSTPSVCNHLYVSFF